MILMYKDIPLASIDMKADNWDGESISIKWNGESISINKEHECLLPFGVNDNRSLLSWVERRSIPESRQGIQKELGVSLAGFMVGNLGLSLTDSYWLKPKYAEDTWESVNLYDNSFYDGHFMRVSGELMAERCEYIPSSTLGGDLRKKWFVSDVGSCCLVKDNWVGIRNSINEVFSGMVHRLQGFNMYVPYWFVNIQTRERSTVGCACSNFVRKGEELVPAIDVACMGDLSNELSAYDAYILGCVKLGIDKRSIEGFMSYMIMTDFILSNTDRKLTDFGLIRRGESYSIAPIYDTGNSMFYNSERIPVSDKELLDLWRISYFPCKSVNLLRHVKYKDAVNVNKLPSADLVYKMYNVEGGFSGEELDRLCVSYKCKCRLLEDFQNGAKLWV